MLRLTFSPWNRLELDLDVPYLTIQRAPGSESSRGMGHTNLGAKWSLRESKPGSYPSRRLPSASMLNFLPEMQARNWDRA